MGLFVDEIIYDLLINYARIIVDAKCVAFNARKLVTLDVTFNAISALTFKTIYPRQICLSDRSLIFRYEVSSSFS